jgi:hypothetical protein
MNFLDLEVSVLQSANKQSDHCIEICIWQRVSDGSPFDIRSA